MAASKTSWLVALGGVACGVAGLVVALGAQDSGPKPQCTNCPGTYLSEGEIKEYVAKAMKERLIDQQIRDVEIGKAHVGVGVVYRGKLDKPAPNSVAEHDLVSEVYHVIDGSATLVTGPDIADMKRRPADLQTVREFNGPGNGGSTSGNRPFLAQANRPYSETYPGQQRKNRQNQTVHVVREEPSLKDAQKTASRPGQDKSSR